MRPLELTFNGLRSYRREHTLDLRDKSLLAIVGDTGAGKSSLLEAIYFALFGTCTWNGSAARVLIADAGNGTLSASLTFTARHKTWKVTRSVSHGSSPGPVHRLECLDDGATVTGSDTVTATVRELIGLDEKTFLKSVILPQGRFQELLHTAAGDRTNALKRLLGLDELGEVRRIAHDKYTRALPQLTALIERRDGLLSDPHQARRDATARRDAQAVVLEALYQAQRDVAEVGAEKVKLTDQHTGLTTALGHLHAAAGTDAAAQLAQLDDISRAIDAEDAALLDQITIGEQQAAAAEQALNGAGAGGPAAEQAINAMSALTAAAGVLNGVGELLRRIDAADAAITIDRDVLAGLTRDADELQRREADTEATAGQLAQRADQAREHRRACELLLAGVRGKRLQYVDLTRQGREAGEKADRADAGAASDEAAAALAEQRLDELGSELEQLRRSHAAAHAAQGAAVGQPCPVCARDLPDDFTPCDSPDLDTATKAYDSARQRHSKLAQAAAASRATAIAARRHLTDLTDPTGQARTDLEAAIAGLGGQVGGFDLDTADDVVLAGVTATAAECAREAEHAAAQLAALRVQAAAARQQQTEARIAIGEREQHLVDSRGQLAGMHIQLAALLTGVPSPYRPADPVTATAISAAHTAAAIDKAAYDQLWQEVSKLQAAIAGLHTDRRDLAARRDMEVTAPAARARHGAQILAGRCRDIAALLGGTAVPDGDAAADIGAQARWAAAIDTCGQELTSAAISRFDALVEELQQCDQRVAQLLAASPAVGGDLQAAIVVAAGAKALAERDLADAERQVPLVDDLEARITQVTPYVNSMRELAALLTDAKFIGAVVAERQEALLGAATVLLRGMTRDRFAFAPEFKIYDANTAQVRDAKTLSGGETFLASLALALAVVEIAGSGGGRAEALFLDEGFGSLDATAMGDALDALALQANSGRLVAVISHMRAVAEHVPAVLLVEKEPTGSTARWLRGQEARQLADADLYDGLLT